MLRKNKPTRGEQGRKDGRVLFIAHDINHQFFICLCNNKYKFIITYLPEK